MKIAFSPAALPKTGTVAVLAADGGKLSAAGQALDREVGGALSRAIKAAGWKGERNACLSVLAPGAGGLDRIVVAGIGDPANLTWRDAEYVGGAIAGEAAGAKVAKLAVLAEAPEGTGLDPATLAARLASGLRLRTYRFDKYKTKADPARPAPLAEATVHTAAATAARRAWPGLAALADGVHLARDLVNEPANELYPETFATRAKSLEKLGVKVEVLAEAQMRKLGMGALLGVAQGSSRPPRLVVMRWSGGRRGAKPVAFIGKGVTFDTGGISIKPAAGMEDMKGDMAGAACVTGLMAALAGRKAKVNAVGIIGLVENMPDGSAQRPGDIVRSMSGQTIAVLNTDAEGRLVLADALWYAQNRFKPKFMVNLATLTGAILVALGKEQAGLFSNDDELAGRLHAAGLATGEKVWRMPLAPEYDKLIDSEVADMKNIGGRNAGSITAAQFLQRFVNSLPWAHLDIAGTGMDAVKSPINQAWGSGWGVRLLDRLVAEHYEA